MGSRVTIDGDARTLLQEMDKISKANAKLSREYKEQADETKRLSRVAEQAMRGIITPTEKYEAKLKDLQAALKAGKLNQDQYNQAVRQAKVDLDKATLSKRGFFDGISREGLAAVGAFTSISGALQAIKMDYEGIIEDQRRLTRNVEDSVKEFRVLAALQERGDRAAAVEQAASLGARYNVPRSEAFDIIQALQSDPNIGTLGKALKVGETVFETIQSGIPGDVAKEAALQASAQGVDVATFSNLLFAAGKASGRSAEEVTRGSRALRLFQGKDLEFGADVLAELVGSFGNDLRTFGEAAGRALGDTSALTETFQRLGVGEGATKEDRLFALYNAGIVSDVDLQRAGLSEERQRAAASTLLGAVATGQFQRRQSTLDAALQDSNIARTSLRDVATELPQVALAQELRKTLDEAKNIDTLGFSTGSRQALERQLLEANIIKSLTERGLGGARPGLDFVDRTDPENPRLNNLRLRASAFLEGQSVRPVPGDESLQAAIAEATQRTAQALEAMQRRAPVPVPETAGGNQ